MVWSDPGPGLRWATQTRNSRRFCRSLRSHRKSFGHVWRSIIVWCLRKAPGSTLYTGNQRYRDDEVNVMFSTWRFGCSFLSMTGKRLKWEMKRDGKERCVVKNEGRSKAALAFVSLPGCSDDRPAALRMCGMRPARCSQHSDSSTLELILFHCIGRFVGK